MKEQTSLYDMIENIVQVVFYSYYSYIKDPELKKDLFQIGYLKAYELLNNGNYDPTMSFRNFIYTGVRNEMHNTLYHINKIKIVDLDLLDKYDNIVGYHDTGDYNIDIQYIKQFTDRFNRFGNYFPSVLNYINNLGLISITKQEEDPNINKDLLESIITLVLWELFEKEKENGYSK